MKKFLCGLALLPFMTAVATAQPAALNENQMDSVTAGWTLLETDVSNTSWTQVGVWTDLPHYCSSCYLNVSSMGINVASNFGPVPTFGVLTTSSTSP